jgi:hypothetical protein
MGSPSPRILLRSTCRARMSSSFHRAASAAGWRNGWLAALWSALVLSLCVASAWGQPPGPPAQATAPLPTLVVLHSEHAGFPAVEAMTRGILSAMRTAGRSTAGIHIEYLDFARNRDAAHRDAVTQLLRRRLHGKKTWPRCSPRANWRSTTRCATMRVFFPTRC